MGRSFSASGGKNVVQSGLNATVRGEFLRSSGMNGVVQGSFLKTGNLVGDVSLYAVYEKQAGLNANISLSTLLNGLLGYWKLDGNSTDSLGLHSGTDTAVTYQAGKLNAGASFNGSTSYIQMAAGIPLDSDNWTIACWWKPNTTSGWDRFFSYYGAGPTFQRMTGTTQVRLVHSGIADWQPTGFTGTLGVWSHLVMTRNGTNFSAYKDGVFLQSTTLSVTFTADSSVRLGNSAAAPAELFNGMLDEAAIWNRALTAGEVDELYNRSLGNSWSFGNFAPLTTQLLGYWKLDGSSSDSLGAANGTDTAITYSVGNGKINQGAGFDGSTSQIDVGSALPLDSSNWTLACWVKPGASVARFLTYYGSGPTLQYDGVGNVALVHAGTLDWNPGIPVTLGVWTHLVVSRRGSQIIAYKNGVQIAINTSFGAAYTKDTTIRFGSSPFIAERLNGALDEVGIWSRGLDAAEVAALYNGGIGRQYSFNDVPARNSGVGGYWKMDGNSNDSLGLSNGVDTAITYPSGKINQAAAFVPASLSLINAGSNPGLEVQGESFTLAAWVNLTASTQDYQSWILRATAANKPQYRFGMQLQTTNWGLSFYNGSTYRDYWVTGSPMPSGTWTHVALVHRKEALTYTFYMNGVQVDVKTGVNRDFLSGTGTFYIGRNIENNSYWNGSIDEVGVWNRALLPEDITAIYNAGAGIQYPF